MAGQTCLLWCEQKERMGDSWCWCWCWCWLETSILCASPWGTVPHRAARKQCFRIIFWVRDFTDVTLASEGETMKEAHKMVLISASLKKIQQKIEQLISNYIQQKEERCTKHLV